MKPCLVNLYGLTRIGLPQYDIPWHGIDRPSSRFAPPSVKVWIRHWLIYQSTQTTAEYNSWMGDLPWQSNFTFVTFKHLFFPHNCHDLSKFALVILQLHIYAQNFAKFYFFTVNNMVSSRFPKDQYVPPWIILFFSQDAELATYDPDFITLDCRLSF